MKLPGFISKALTLLENAGYEAVVVGGAVRDSLLGLSPHDYDISTNALPEEIKEVFRSYHTLDFGIKHGTVTVFIKNRAVEITTYRREEDYEDFRHPKKVIFEKDLRIDLSRRDFTINSLCYNNRLIDLLGGVKDLNEGLIRAIGEAKERFFEDPLRILRALRFASTLDFQIEEKTKKALFEYADLLDKVSFERINVEFSKLILGKAAAKVLREYLEIIQVFLPELRKEEVVSRCDAIHNVDSLEQKITVLFSDIDLEKTKLALKRIKYSNLQIKEIVLYLENLKLKIKPNSMQLTKLLKTIDIQNLERIVEVQAAINRNNSLSKIKDLLDNIKNKNEVYCLKDLKISGSDLLKIGFKEGVGIRLILDKVLDLVIEGRIANDKEEIERYVKENFLNKEKIS